MPYHVPRMQKQIHQPQLQSMVLEFWIWSSPQLSLWKISKVDLTQQFVLFFFFFLVYSEIPLRIYIILWLWEQEVEHLTQFIAHFPSHARSRHWLNHLSESIWLKVRGPSGTESLFFFLGSLILLHTEISLLVCRKGAVPWFSQMCFDFFVLGFKSFPAYI